MKGFFKSFYLRNLLNKYKNSHAVAGIATAEQHVISTRLAVDGLWKSPFDELTIARLMFF
jgi:hypothetical protein